MTNVVDRASRAISIIKTLRIATKGMIEPAAASIVKTYGRDPFLVLISCLLSLRTKDSTSLPASHRLFEYARSPQQMLSLSLSAIQELIYPVGFYRVKSKTIHALCQQLLTQWSGKVPSTMDDLLTLPGVGRKTANLVLGQGFQIPALCVDIHVHRISNRLGIVTTKNPHETEEALKQLLPTSYWTEYNELIVMWGQNICVPRSPFCSRCAIADRCQRVGVSTSR